MCKTGGGSVARCSGVFLSLSSSPGSALLRPTRVLSRTAALLSTEIVYHIQPLKDDERSWRRKRTSRKLNQCSELKRKLVVSLQSATENRVRHRGLIQHVSEASPGGALRSASVPVIRFSVLALVDEVRTVLCGPLAAEPQRRTD